MQVKTDYARPYPLVSRPFIDTCINNARFGKPNAWKSRLPLVAFRSLAMHASIEHRLALSFSV